MDVKAKFAHRVAVIGLDAGDRDLVREWANAGDLPAFASLLGDSLQGEIANPDCTEAGTALPSFYFGSDPGMHGQYDGLIQFDPVTYRQRIISQDYQPVPPIWNVLSAAGRRSIVVDAPYVHLPPGAFNGTFLIDWMTHVPSVGGTVLNPISLPGDFAAAVVAEFGGDGLGGRTCDLHSPRSAEEARAFREGLVRRVAAKRDLCLKLIRDGGWDFLLTVFADAHCVGHHCWRYHDRQHVDHEPKAATAVGDPIRDVYRALDAAVGALLAAVDEHTTVVVYLSHGMGPGYTGTRLLDRILAGLDGYQPRKPPLPLEVARRMWRAAPSSVRSRLSPLYRATRDVRQATFNRGFVGGEPQRRFFEQMNNDRTGGVRINLIGRESQGRVSPDEYDAVCDWLAQELQAIINVETGEPLVQRVARARDLYSGPETWRLPDLLVTWNRSAPINVVASPSLGTLRHDVKSHRSGDHKPGGYFFARGPGLSHRVLNQVVPVIDFAPTIARRLGVNGDAFQGRPLVPLLGEPGTLA
jgi:predicted AlkP superfamily phosphohydrolase/phosphomutase